MNIEIDIVNIKTETETTIRTAVKKIIDNHSGRGALTVITAKYNNGLPEYIKDHTSFLDILSWVNFQTRCYLFANNITKIEQLPHCATCGKLIPKNVISVHVGFKYRTCSRKCSANETSRNEKRKITMLKTYGEENYNNREKYRKTCLERFGVECNLQSEDTIRKSKLTKLERHGDENYVNSEQAKQTCAERYGMGNNGNAISKGKKEKLEADPNYYRKIDERGKKTRLTTYGDENYNNRQQSDATKIEKYGTPTYNNRKKASCTCMKRYGVDNPAKLDSTKLTSKETCMERYGVDNPAKLDSTKEKSEKTNNDRFGVSHYAKTEYARLKTSIRKSSEYFNAMLASESNRAIPLFSFEEFQSRTCDTELKWRCAECGKEFTAPINMIYARQSGTYARCPDCHPAPISGSCEQQLVQNFIQSIYSEEIEINDRRTIYPLEIDIYMPQLKMGIEFNGLYWHSAIWRSDLRHMSEKSRICENKEICLIQVMEDEWKNFRKQTEWRIAQQLNLNKMELKQDFTINKITDREFDAFMARNSNDQYAKKGKTKIGITSGEAMVSVASLTIYNDKIIIYTIQNAIGRNIQNTAKLLVDYIKKEYGKTSIFIKLDNRYPYDKPVVSAGFQLIKITAPAKWILDARKWKRIPRQKYAKIQQIAKNNNQCEIDYLHDSGMTVIYDCGQRVYRYNDI